MVNIILQCSFSYIIFSFYMFIALLYFNSTNYYYLIFSEVDEPLGFNQTLINGSVLNVVSINNICFCRNHYLKSYHHIKLFNL